ncbi:AAA family ATPase [Paenibacillus luteus]|uniref:AAA family ATPase n=1 Tax=Paenibacillus luteus TaxID=2545753 RepID=UPI001142C2D0|nr:AAA family ATPase [Paenibacillus luteus]
MREDQFKEKILNTIISWEKHVTSGKDILRNYDQMNPNQILTELNQLFIKEEAAIEREKRKSFVTDTYEDNVRFFARQLIVSIIPSHNDLKDNKEYRKLLKKRHIAYGFYSAFDRILDYSPKVLEDSELKKALYLGLVDFYEKFFGKFSDNEEAIKLLCGYYPKDIDLTEQYDSIVKALYKHIFYAGSTSDSGFAYNGIDQIRKHIGNLPLEIIDKLLRKYELFRIINEKVYRHQIFAIIDNINITKSEKFKYKFSYIDSLVIANEMNRNLYDKYSKNDSGSYTRYYTQPHSNLSEKKLGLIIDTRTDNISGYWTNECSAERQFILNEKVLLDMKLDMDKELIHIKYIDKPTINTEFSFDYTDWMLDVYHSKETYQVLHDFVFELKNGEVDIVYRHLTFSLLYLNEFRGLSEQLINFDHKFTFDSSSKELGASAQSSVVLHFYGSKVYSLSCIVGKNGTGKTSTVDFLRDTFFRLLRLIGENQISSEDGYVNEINYKEYRLLDESCKFFVAFHLDNEPYYLTNIADVTVTSAKPFDHSTYKTVNELSKIVYFSNKLSIIQDTLYIDEISSRQVKKEKEDLANSLKSFRQADYSEEASFIQKRKALDLAKNHDMKTMVVNRDLCYQLSFLHNFNKEELESFFDMPQDKVFVVNSISIGYEEVTTLDLRDMFNGKHTRYNQFLTVPDAKLDYFSSGQYAKFSFLAKLYWFLEGYQKYNQVFEFLVGKNEFSHEEALLEGGTALLFIDEGELYYHPEWQRRYIKTLIDIIENAASKDSKLQVVITTNSPFIISDILKEDITYLSAEKKEFDRTFGQNIHKLLKDNFFMEYTIGEYSRKVIEEIMKWLYSDEIEADISKELSRYFGNSVDSKEYYERIRYLIDKIGEPVYREKLFDILSNSKFGIPSKREELLRQKAEIERTLQELGES